MAKRKVFEPAVLVPVPYPDLTAPARDSREWWRALGLSPPVAVWWFEPRDAIVPMSLSFNADTGISVLTVGGTRVEYATEVRGWTRRVMRVGE